MLRFRQIDFPLRHDYAGRGRVLSLALAFAFAAGRTPPQNHHSESVSMMPVRHNVVEGLIDTQAYAVRPLRPPLRAHL